MAEVKKATNSLTKETTGTVAEKKKSKTIFDIIKAGEKQFAAALPKHLNSERFTRIAITTVRQNPKLAECNPESLLGSLMIIAQLGLEPGVLGQCYLIPYGTECQFQLGYKGMIELLRRTGQLNDIYAYTVYSNDEFSIEYGLDRTLKHIPAFTNPDGRGEIVGFYSVAILKDGTRAFEYMTKQEIISHEEKYRKGKYKNSVWEKNFEEMALKTVTKKMLKWLPISIEMIENLRKDEQIHKLDDKTNEITSEYLDDVIQYDEAGVIVEDKPTTEDMQTLLTIANANGVDINLKAKELYNNSNLANITMKQYEELKSIAIEG